MRSPVIEIEQMARPIQFHWLARDQACGEDEIQKRSGLFAFAFSSNGAQAFVKELVVHFEEHDPVKDACFFEVF